MGTRHHAARKASHAVADPDVDSESKLVRDDEESG
jgi:hypothetical protein